MYIGHHVGIKRAPRLRAVSLFLENGGEERRTSKRASVTLTCCVLPHGFQGKERMHVVYVSLFFHFPTNVVHVFVVLT